MSWATVGAVPPLLSVAPEYSFAPLQVTVGLPQGQCSAAAPFLTKCGQCPQSVPNSKLLSLTNLKKKGYSTKILEIKEGNNDAEQNIHIWSQI